MDVVVWDMSTEEEVLMGARHVESDVNPVRVHYTDLIGSAWRRNASVWMDDMLQSYREAVYNIQHYNDFGVHVYASDAGPEDLDNIKSFIISHEVQQRISSNGMVLAAGFNDIEFPSTLPYQEQDLEALAVSGDIDPNFMPHMNKTNEQRQKYAVHALDYRNTVTRALEEGHEWVTMFEVDVVLTTPPSVASERIRQAMADGPPDTDRYGSLGYIACCEQFAKE